MPLRTTSRTGSVRWSLLACVAALLLAGASPVLAVAPDGGPAAAKQAAKDKAPKEKVNKDRDAPAQVTGLTGTPDDGLAVLAWQPAAETDLHSYQVHQDGLVVATVPAGTTTVTVPALTNGTAYAFTLSAVDTSGNVSAASSAVVVTPVAPPPGVALPFDPAATPGIVELPHGLFHHLGTAGGTEAYRNPTTSGVVAVEASTNYALSTAPQNATDKRARMAHSTDGLDNTLTWTLPEGASMQVDHYALRNRANEYPHHLRSWVLEGSHDGDAWQPLRSHASDASLVGVGSAASWAVHADVGYRHLRLRNTGPDSYGTNYLIVDEIELYGTYRSDSKTSLPLDPAAPLTTAVLQPGLFGHLGTAGGTLPYTNPTTTGLITVTASSGYSADGFVVTKPEFATDRTTALSHSDNSVGNTVTWVLTAGQAVDVDHYALRTRSDGHPEHLRNWVLEGSDDGSTWALLSSHVADISLLEGGSDAVWPVAAEGAWSQLRLRNTGPDNWGTDYLIFDEIEVYGTLLP